MALRSGALDDEDVTLWATKARSFGGLKGCEGFSGFAVSGFR